MELLRLIFFLNFSLSIDSLKTQHNCLYDEKDSIGKRYRRNDAIGTPFCITIDYDTLNDQAVTVRNRDTMNQERIKIDDSLSIYCLKEEDVKKLVKKIYIRIK